MATDHTAIESGASNRRGRARGTVRDYLSTMKLEITFANLMATFAGLWVGSHGHPQFVAVLATLLGTAFVVMSAAALNNYIDRDIDIKMERTKERAMVAGRVNPAVVLSLAVVLGAVGFAALLLIVNLTAALCGLFGLIVYAYIYTVWLKRHTTLSTILGGVSGAMPPIIGWAGGDGGHLGLGALVLFAVFLFWQPPHFLPLAMKRTEEYRKAKIPMLPVVHGFRRTKWEILGYTVLMVPTSVLLFTMHDEGWLYLVGASLFGLYFLYEAVCGLFVTKQKDLEWANGLFRYSLIYITAICVLLIVGVH